MGLTEEDMDSYLDTQLIGSDGEVRVTQASRHGLGMEVEAMRSSPVQMFHPLS